MILYELTKEKQKNSEKELDTFSHEILDIKEIRALVGMENRETKKPTSHRQ
jgi:protein subunit release factor B